MPEPSVSQSDVQTQDDAALTQPAVDSIPQKPLNTAQPQQGAQPEEQDAQEAQNADVQTLAVQPDTQTQYEIYPTVHQITYQDQALVIPSEIAVTFGDGVDDVTKQHLRDTLALVAGSNVTEGAGSAQAMKVQAVLQTDMAAVLPGYTPATADLFTHSDAYILQVTHRMALCWLQRTMMPCLAQFPPCIGC